MDKPDEVYALEDRDGTEKQVPSVTSLLLGMSINKIENNLYNKEILFSYYFPYLDLDTSEVHP